MRWLTKPAIAPVLSDLAAGRTPLTHQAFDELRDTQALAHLRQTLVAVGALPERDEELVRLERFLAGLLAAQPDPDRRKILHRYRSGTCSGGYATATTAGPPPGNRSLRSAATPARAGAFLDWLDAHNLTLGTVHAGRSRPLAHRRLGRLPLRDRQLHPLGTRQQAHHRSTSPPSAGAGPPSRWMTSTAGTPRAGCCTTTTSTPRTGSPGLLVLLYAQGATTISRLTVEHDPHRRPRRSSAARAACPSSCPSPSPPWPATVVAHRKGHATIGAVAPSPWLFPGGQPGRPISAARLTQRLDNLGIRPNQARSTALFQLATEIPAAILARTLGIHTDVAVTWQRLSAGDWTSYAAEVSRRDPRHSDSSNT